MNDERAQPTAHGATAPLVFCPLLPCLLLTLLAVVAVFGERVRIDALVDTEDSRRGLETRSVAAGGWLVG